MNDSAIPLCIDFDGTLTSTSLRLEQMLQLAKQSPGRLMPLLRMGVGHAGFRRELAGCSNIDLATLPLRPDLLAWLEQERQAGRRLVLVVDGNQDIADRVAGALPLFDDC